MCESMASGYHSPIGPLVSAQRMLVGCQARSHLWAIADEKIVVVFEKTEPQRLAINNRHGQHQTAGDGPGEPGRIASGVGRCLGKMPARRTMIGTSHEWNFRPLWHFAATLA